MGVIDRRSVVDRHVVDVDRICPESPLSVGNGELCFTVDVTGLQSLPDAYPLVERSGGRPGTLLGTQAQWGWHVVPAARAVEPAATERVYRTRRGPVPYVDYDGPLDPPPGVVRDVDQWLRANPHRLDLGRIAFKVADDTTTTSAPRALTPGEVGTPRQRLELWTGALHSSFVLAGRAVEVETSCDPERDLLAVRVRSEALVEGGLCVTLAFSYGSMSWNDPADWSCDARHQTILVRRRRDWQVERVLDDSRYWVTVSGGPAIDLDQVGPHLVVVRSAAPELELCVELSPEPVSASRPDLTDRAARSRSRYGDVASRSASHWAQFWSSGAAVDLGQSTDARAPELERRIVLSQYLTAIECAGSLPPQETGLTVNSWYGRFHMEMHWWHAAHFALWGRPQLLERSMSFYARHLPAARERARHQGYDGARWPKQVGPDGREGPSPISAFLIWQQPHPIYLAELIWRADPVGALERYAAIVLESAAFMADVVEPTADGYALGPPVVPAQECYAPGRAVVSNPTFELAYWSFGLEVAERWRERLGLGAVPRWSSVRRGLCRPHVTRGRYDAIGVPPYLERRDHPSTLLALGFLPPTEMIVPSVMDRTLDDVLENWDWASTWGWDFPAIAMAAARLGRPEDAIDVLTMDVEKNQYLRSGHNPQSATLPLYLPGNGALLAAIALMAGGFEGCTRTAPGFPVDGAWRVEQEGFPGAP